MAESRNTLSDWQPFDLTATGYPHDAVLSAPVMATLAAHVEREAAELGISRGLALQIVIAAGLIAVRVTGKREAAAQPNAEGRTEAESSS